MRRIGFLKTALTFSVCFVAGIGFSVAAAYAFRPLPVAEARIPVTNFDSIQGLKGGSIYANNPFRAAAPVNMSLPDAPGVPAMPSMPGGMSETEKTVVLGVLPPDVCIISHEGKNYTLRIGDSTPFGKVEAISGIGVTVDGAFYRIK